MKKLIVLLIMVFAGSAFSQDFADITFRKLTFYNTAGTAKTNLASGDTLASERINIDASAFSWGMTTGSGVDTMKANFYYRFGAGAGAGLQGYYTQGGQALSTLQDSIATFGGRDGDATAAHIMIPLDPITGNTQTTVGVFVGNVTSGTSRDSTRTVTNSYANTATSSNGWQWFQIVIIAYATNSQNNLGTAGLAKSLVTFNTNRLIRRGMSKAR
jgi:hypothetical protein